MNNAKHSEITNGDLFSTPKSIKRYIQKLDNLKLQEQSNEKDPKQISKTFVLRLCKHCASNPKQHIVCHKAILLA